MSEKLDLELPVDYIPSENEEYMNPMQLKYFHNKLDSWRKELIEQSELTIAKLREEHANLADQNDQATNASYWELELRTRNRYRKLIDKIDFSINRIHSGEYGYCEETGKDIGLPRLSARPIASLSIEAQMRHENYEDTHADE